jgi:hypothetical protein
MAWREPSLVRPAQRPQPRRLWHVVEPNSDSKVLKMMFEIDWALGVRLVMSAFVVMSAVGSLLTV